MAAKIKHPIQVRRNHSRLSSKPKPMRATGISAVPVLEEPRHMVAPKEAVANNGAADHSSVTEEVVPHVERERGSYDGDTAIKLYLREIGQVQLLTPQQEIELAARIKKGDKKARELMIKANLRLVVKIARDYEGIGLPLL